MSMQPIKTTKIQKINVMGDDSVMMMLYSIVYMTCKLISWTLRWFLSCVASLKIPMRHFLAWFVRTDDFNDILTTNVCILTIIWTLKCLKLVCQLNLSISIFFNQNWIKDYVLACQYRKQLSEWQVSHDNVVFNSFCGS